MAARKKETKSQVKTQKPAARGNSRKSNVEEPKSSATLLQLRGLGNLPVRFSKKVRYTVLAVVLLGLLVLLASRYLVIAWVDNKPITRFEYYNAMDKKYGNETRENLIVEKLFVSEASKRKINVTNQEINDEIAKIEKQQGGKEQLNQALAANNISRDELFTRIRLELLKQKMFGNGVDVSDSDVDKYIEANKQSLPSTLTDNSSSESAKMKEGLKQQLKQQKVDQEFNKWLTEALKSSRIVRI